MPLHWYINGRIKIVLYCIEILQTSNGKNAKVIGVDPVSKMINNAKTKHKSFKNVTYLTKDILLVELKACDMIINYYTIQFIEQRVKQNIVDNIYNTLNWGGGFFLFENVCSPDARFQDI